jgi:acyl-coenzyme A thioesterase PaaI-like protein
VANLFGLQLEVEPLEEGGVRGRFFVKQDHQGPPGFAHGGVIAAALDEAMSLAIHAEGTLALTSRFEVELRAPVPVGTFVAVEARFEGHEGDRIELSAALRDADGERDYAKARGLFVEVNRRPVADH